jgi:plastocyanin
MKMWKLTWLMAVVVFAANAHAAQRQVTTNKVDVMGGTGQPNFVFSPTNLLVFVGDSVRWTNTINNRHDVTPGTRAGGTNRIDPYWTATALSNLGSTFTVTFSNVGAYPYFCGTHVFPVIGQGVNQTGLVTVAVFNFPPTVGITSPSNFTRFTAPPSFVISADAADSDGTVTNVQFFTGSTLIGSASTAPYAVTASSLAAGWHQLTARALDNVGAAATSAVVNVFVNSNRTVVANGLTLTFSPSNLTVTVGDTVNFDGLASFHTVTGDTTFEPFCGTVAPPESCTVTFNTVGKFPFHCIPHQAFGMTGLVTVVGPNLVPFARITSPAEGSVFAAPATFAVSAEASDLFGIVSNVTFVRNNTTLIARDTNSPFSVTVSNLAAGSYVLTARPADTTGLTSTSAPVNITVITATPIQLLSPNANAAGFTFDFTANPGLTYVIEGSAADGSPTPFVPLATNVANTNPMKFTDPTALGRSNRAYRVLRQP